MTDIDNDLGDEIKRTKLFRPWRDQMLEFQVGPHVKMELFQLKCQNEN